MSIEALSWAFDQNLHPTQKVLLLAIANYSDEDGWCFPSQETLAEKSSLSVATVRRTTTKLVEAGLVEVELRYSHTTGYRTSNGYHLPLNVSGRPTAHRSTVSGRREPSVKSSTTRARGKTSEPEKVLIPEDFEVTEAMRSWAAEKFPAVDVDEQTERFIEHAQANGRMMVDWTATWRTWIRRADGFRGGGDIPPQPNTSPRGPVRNSGRYADRPPVPPAPFIPKVDLSDGFMPAFPPPLPYTRPDQ